MMCTLQNGFCLDTFLRSSCEQEGHICTIYNLNNLKEKKKYMYKEQLKQYNYIP